MSIETVKVSQAGKEQLIRLKRLTGIEQWNVLCRWGLATSLADPSPPLVRHITTDSNIEMTWKTFAGANTDIYLGILRQRCHQDGVPVTDENVANALTVHLHRGIGYLAGDRSVSSIEGLMSLVVDRP